MGRVLRMLAVVTSALFRNNKLYGMWNLRIRHLPTNESLNCKRYSAF